MKLEINDRATGFLFLLLYLLLCYSLKPASIDSKFHRPAGEEDLFIQVAGDVKFPGVYRFSHHPNLKDLIDRAGGLYADIFLPEAFRDSKFSSGMEVTFCRETNSTKVSLSEMSAFYKTTLGIPISVNRESETGLTAVPGIGQGLAKAIVQERSKRGGFKTLDEVLSVRGIGPRLYEKIRHYLTL